MIKSGSKQIFLLKMTLATVLGYEAGWKLSDGFHPSGIWDGIFIYSFCSLIGIVIMQWVLLSDYLPNRWVIAGLAGCILSAGVSATINYSVPEQYFRLVVKELNIFGGLLTGILVAAPQWFVLKHRRGDLWLGANAVGWLVCAVYRSLANQPQLAEILRTFILDTSLLPLGLFLSYYLYSYIYQSPGPVVMEKPGKG